MRSPFPGMDPYLEDRWRDVHASLVLYSRDQLQSQITPCYRARVEERVVLDAPDDSMDGATFAPDVKIVLPRQAGARRPANEGSVAVLEAPPVAQPDVTLISKHELLTETFIQIIDAKDGAKVVTVIEFLSPTNKREGEDRRAYQKKQQELLESDIAFVEVDLLRGGIRTLQVPVSTSPKLKMHYAAVVTRRDGYDRLVESYGFDLRERLPAIRIPLRAPDKDVLLDLQKVVDLAYVNGGYDITDYSKPPVPPLSDEDAAWAGQLVAAPRT